MANPVYQPVAPEDYERMATIAAQSFGGDAASVLQWLQSPERTDEARGLYEDGQLVSQMELLTFEIQTGRGRLRCGGIGGVATPPEQRRRGHVARLLRGACEELRERGITLVLLDAFKDSFYRRYGWAPFSERRRYSAAPERFTPFRDRHGRFMPAGNDQIAELDAIYQGGLRGRFGPVVRTPAWWRVHVLGSNTVYLWRDDQGRARAYTIYRISHDAEGNVLRCREMIALDPEARAQLFALLANHDSHVKRIQFDAPTDAPVNLLFADPLECTVAPCFMLRIIDVAALLSAYQYPADCAGRLTFAVDDDWLAHNRGPFTLEVDQSGIGRCSRAADDAIPGLRCDIRVLAQLTSRYVRPRTAAAFGLIEAPDRDALALAERLFAGLQPFFSDDF
jgi:predicted acetyltransferase